MPERGLGRLAPASLLPFGLAALSAVGLAAASIFRHDHFGSNAYDLGLFDQTIWGYSTLELIPNTVLRLPNALGDHFHPILMALAPLYWLWDDPRVLLVAQAALIALSSVPLHLWARAQLGVAAATLFQLAYLVFWAVLGGNLFDFHELALAAPILSFALYGLLTRTTWLLLAMAVLALLTREDLALTFVAIGVYLAVVQRRWRLGLGLAAVCLGWFAVMVTLVIPALADRDYAHWAYGGLGSGPASALAHLVTEPIDSLRLFFTPEAKRTSLFNLLAPWLGLPLASPLLIVMLPALAARYLSDKPSHWAPQGFHYSLALAPLLAFAAVDTTARLRRLLGARRATSLPVAIGAGVLAAGLYFSFHRIAPLDELERYTSERKIGEIRDCLRAVPPHASVAATSALVPHLSHRDRVYVLDRRPLPRTDYLAIDTSTWRHPLTLAELDRLVTRTLARPGWGVACSKGGTVVLARGAPSKALAPELRSIFARS